MPRIRVCLSILSGAHIKELGVAEVFTPGVPTQAIIDSIRSATTVRT